MSVLLRKPVARPILAPQPAFFGGRMKSSGKLLVIPLILLLVGLACNIGAPAPSTPDPFATLNALYTAAVQTEQASGSPVASNTPIASNTPLGQATATIGLPTLIYKTNTPPAPVAYCNAASFVKDVSIADGTVIGQGQNFTKTWRIQNVGTCRWNPN